jgi:cell division protein FtsI (penicillin-binding protein 3)
MLNIKNEVLVRVYLVAAAVLLIGILISFRLFQLGVTDAPKWKRKADEQFLRWVDSPQDRGNILADDGSLLATSLPFFDVHFDAKAEGLTDEVFYEHVDSLAMLLSTYIDPQFTPGEYKKWLEDLHKADAATKGVRYALVAKRLPYTKMQMLKNFPLFRLGRYKGGLIVEQRPERERPYKMMAQRTIGYVREGALPVGLEGAFDNILGGTGGKRLMLRVPGDYYIPLNDLAEIEPRPGDDIVTTLDVNIQDAAENALLEALETHEANHGCAVVMEVKTGKIRAMANIGRTPEGWWETFNYAVGERVEPGSMFKLASFMAMIEDGHIDDLDQKVPVYGGKVKIYTEELVDATPHSHDSMTIRQVFAQSSNVGTATMVQGFYGGSKAKNGGFVSRLREFGLGMPTGVEVGGEEMPFIKDPSDPKAEWSGTTLPWMSIGYELLLTPIQVLQFYNAVANNGRMMKPYLVQRIEHYGEPVTTFEPTVQQRSIASQKTIRAAHQLLRQVVEDGTAKNINPKHYKIAGKTGTTQLNYHKFRANAGIRHQASFCGFFPAENPVYSCIVVINEPKSGGYHGAEVAAPVFKKIADKCYAMKGEMHTPIAVKDDVRLAFDSLPTYDAGLRTDMEKSLRWLGLDYLEPEGKAESEWVTIKAAPRDSLIVMNRGISDKLVPSVVGMGLKDAIYLLENRGCKVRVEGVGRVQSQSVAPGTKANGKTLVVLKME